MITGAQIRQARKLLGWEPFQLAQRARLHPSIVQRAESVDVEPPITAYQEALKPLGNTVERDIRIVEGVS